MPALPPPLPTSRSRLPPEKPYAPAARPSPQAASTSIPQVDRTSKPYLQRRSVVYAVGIAVIAGAGALIGAQLKTRKQITDIKKHSPNPLATPITAPVAEQVPTASIEDVKKDIATQLAFLESRRGQLLYQKDQTEQKIQGLKDRQKRKDELEVAREQMKARQKEQTAR